jgi:hypothetical protein
VCKSCNYTKIAYNSCLNRSCPQCGWVGMHEWIRKTVPKIMDYEHFHLIFTIPEELNQIWIKNTKLMIQLLFKAVGATLAEFSKTHLGAQLGCMMNLHTWSRTMNLHPHIHCLVTAGGYDKRGKWIDAGDYLFPVLALSPWFRTRLLLSIRENAEKLGGLDFVNKIIRPLFEKDWNVFTTKKYSHGRGVIRYLANYIKGGPIKNSRIVSYNGHFVTIRYKDIKDQKWKTMTLTAHEFIRRFVMHLVPKRLRTLRFAGFYASKKFALPKLPENDKHIDKRFLQNREEICPYCNTTLIIVPHLTRITIRKFIHPPSPYKAAA